MLEVESLIYWSPFLIYWTSISKLKKLFCFICPPKQFSYDIAEKAAKVCLAHLFTYQDFDMGTLGLAYVASQKPNSHGGICPKGNSLSTLDLVFLLGNECKCLKKKKSMYLL